MQWLSIYGDSKSSLFQILLYSGQRFMSLVLCCWLEMWVLFIKLLRGWRRSPRYRPVWPSRPCWDAQEATSAAAPGPRKCLASVFVFIPALFPFRISLSYLYSPLHLTFLFAALTPFETDTVFNISSSFVSTRFKLLGQGRHSGRWIQDTFLY